MKIIEKDLQTLQRQEAEFAKTHKRGTDEELIAYLVKCSKELGRYPKKDEIVGHTYLKVRLGPWPRILERAGLKEKSQKRTQKEQKMNWTENSKSVINHGSINHHKKQAEKKFLRELKKPERVMLENEFSEQHKNDTDAELYEYLKELKAKCGKRLNPTNTIGYTYLVKRLSAWNEVMRQISMDLKNENERIGTT